MKCAKRISIKEMALKLVKARTILFFMKTRFLKQKHNFFSPPPELMVVLFAFYLASKEHSVLKIDIKLGNGLLQAINFFFNRKKWIIFYRIFIS